MLCLACEFKLQPNGDKDKVDIKVHRYDRIESRYLTTGDFSALQQMNTDYPMETRTLIEKVLQIGKVEDPEINNKFLRFYQDSILRTIIVDISTEYANMDDIDGQLTEAFKKLHEWLPNMPIPLFYAQIGALDQSIIVGDKSVGISLDKYMGRNYPIYKKYYTMQQMETMGRDHIVPDCVSFYLLSTYPMANFDLRSQMERDLRVGKVMWITNKAMGAKFFNTPYVNMVDRYMSGHKNVTVSQLLSERDSTGTIN